MKIKFVYLETEIHELPNVGWEPKHEKKTSENAVRNFGTRRRRD